MRVQLPLKTTWYCHTHRKNSLHSLPHSERIFRSDRGCFTHRGEYSKPAIQVSGPTAAAPVAAAEVSLTVVKRWSERRFSQKGGSNEQVTEKTSSNDFGNTRRRGFPGGWRHSPCLGCQSRTAQSRNLLSSRWLFDRFLECPEISGKKGRNSSKNTACQCIWLRSVAQIMLRQWSQSRETNSSSEPDPESMVAG